MDYIIQLLKTPLNALMSLCHSAAGNYILTILLFTLATRLILLPVSLWVQKNGIKMVRMMPEINRLKIDYYGDKETIAEKTQELYKREKYHPLSSTVPLVIQLVLLMGVVEAVKDLLGTSESTLLRIPSETGGWLLLMPLGAGLASLILTIAQNRIGPLQREQEKAEKLLTGAVSVCISLFLGAFVSVGTCIYWIFSNLIAIPLQLLYNRLVDPRKYVDYEALEKSRRSLAAISDLQGEVSKEDKRREREDYKRFFSVANKHLVFYSEKSGFYKYFRNVIEYLLSHSNVIIHYVTSDPKDRIFELAKQQPRIRPYYIGEKKLITLFMKMDADIVVMTTPDLDNFYLKRSYVRKDIEYIYMFHGMASTNMVVRKGAYDHFDTVFCVGQHQVEELRECEEMYGLPAKTLVPCGYGMLDDLVAAYSAMSYEKHETPQVMVAPSWQEGNIIESCLDAVLDTLLAKRCRVILRPHPEFIKRFPEKVERMRKQCEKYGADLLELQLDFSSNESIYTSDVLITDWSGIAYEFAYTTRHPVIFVDTPIKVLNEDYTKYKNQPTDITLRNQVGRSIPLGEMERFPEVFEDIMSHTDAYEKAIGEVVSKYVFNIGESGKTGAQYILSALQAKQKRRTTL